MIDLQQELGGIEFEKLERLNEVASKYKGNKFVQMQLIAIDSWAALMPVSYAVQMCLNERIFRPYMKRHIEVIYDYLQADYDTLFYEYIDWSE